MSSIIFLRGLTTYQDDNFRFGFLNFGPAHKHLEPKFQAKGMPLIAPPGIGHGEIGQQVETAYLYLLGLSRENKINGFVHLLGHSSGGVVARGLAHKLSQNPITNITVKSVVSIASPHHGSQLALAMLSTKLSLWKKLFFLGGYNLEKRKHHFTQWLPERITTFNANNPNVKNIAYGSITAGIKTWHLPLALRLMHIGNRLPGLWTDGIVELDSQAWGNVLGRYELDHGALLGMRTILWPPRYRRDQKTFENIVDKITLFMSEAELK
ncbi:MAG: hypothetical protein A2Z20_00830 [Bdellovibrionales bacterium RBG_16_40_8]|nr:MAG: hypothetical protein A2Z20_00830 [Bdellovibrionales bacterium RBG_16_40_8]